MFRSGNSARGMSQLCWLLPLAPDRARAKATAPVNVRCGSIAVYDGWFRGTLLTVPRTTEIDANHTKARWRLQTDGSG